MEEVVMEENIKPLISDNGKVEKLDRNINISYKTVINHARVKSVEEESKYIFD